MKLQVKAEDLQNCSELSLASLFTGPGWVIDWSPDRTQYCIFCYRTLIGARIRRRRKMNRHWLVDDYLTHCLSTYHTHITWLYGWGAALSSDSVFGSPPHCQSVINGSNWLNCVFEPANAPHSLQRHSDPRNGMASCVIIHEWWQDHMEMRKGQVVRFASGCVLTMTA